MSIFFVVAIGCASQAYAMMSRVAQLGLKNKNVLHKIINKPVIKRNYTSSTEDKVLNGIANGAAGIGGCIIGSVAGSFAGLAGGSLVFLASDFVLDKPIKLEDAQNTGILAGATAGALAGSMAGGPVGVATVSSAMVGMYVIDKAKKKDFSKKQ